MEFEVNIDTLESQHQDFHQRLMNVIAEVSAYEVHLEEDPTLPHLGNRYLQLVLARCRTYLNRVHHYQMVVKRLEKSIGMDVRNHELDLELKMSELLADNPTVRNQPAIDDRKALATSMLRSEHEILAKLRLQLMDVQETAKILKAVYEHLGRTNADIKVQRALIKDDRALQEGGQEGFSRTQSGQDGAVPDGLPPVATASIIDPRDLLDPDKRPEDLPVPVDAIHARQIADFFSSKVTPAKPAQTSVAPIRVSPDPANLDGAESRSQVSFEDLLDT